MSNACEYCGRAPATTTHTTTPGSTVRVCQPCKSLLVQMEGRK